jgi:PrcB C-terminal
VGALEFTHITVFRTTSRDKLLEVLRRNNPGLKIRLPRIDFARQEAFLVATGPRSATGYALRIVRVQENSDRITVFVHERTPSLGDRVEARVTYPFRLIVLNSHKRVRLKWPGRP